MNYPYSYQDEQLAFGGVGIVKQIAVNPLDEVTVYLTDFNLFE